MFECVLLPEDNSSPGDPSQSVQPTTVLSHDQNLQNQLITKEIIIKEEPIDLELSGGQQMSGRTWPSTAQDYSTVPKVQQQPSMNLLNVAESWQGASPSSVQYHQTPRVCLPSYPSCHSLSQAPPSASIHQEGTKVQSSIAQFLCEICCANFQSDSLLKRHVEISHGALNPVVRVQRAGERYKTTSTATHLMCFTCNSRFTTNFQLKHHVKKVHNQSEVTKTTSRRVSQSPVQNAKTLTVQQSKVLDNLPKCIKCQAIFISNNALQEHLKLHSQVEDTLSNKKKNFTCQVCNLKMKSKSEMMKHMIKAHCEEESDSETELISCSDCDFKCLSESEMHAHSSFHNVFKYKCQYCEINVISKNQLDKHISISHKDSQCITTSHITNSKRKTQLPNQGTNKKLKVSDGTSSPNNVDNTSNLENQSDNDNYSISSFIIQTHQPKIEQDFIKTEPSSDCQIQMNNLICNLCNESFSIKKSLYMHTETQHNDVILEHKIAVKRQKGKESDGEYKCDLCTTSFTMFDYLIDHKFKHRGIKPYSCKYCFKHFPTSKTISTHYKQLHVNEIRSEVTHLEQITAPSTKTDKNLDRSKFDKDYMKPTLADSLSKRKMVTVCSICRIRYSKMSDLYKHCVEKHQNSKQIPTVKYNQKGGGPIECNECGLGFTDIYTQRHHLMRHFKIKPYMCKYCGKLYSSPASVHEHFTRHHNGDLIRDGLKPLKPRDSGSKRERYPTYSEGFLKRQEKKVKIKKGGSKIGVNTIDSWYSTKVECDICKVTLAHKQQLEKHMKSFHLSEFIKSDTNSSVIADIDDNKFLPKDGVIVYSFVCNLCKEGFYRKSVLYTHALQSHKVVRKKIHESTPFIGGNHKCTDCKYTFSKSELLEDHTFKHRGIKPYACTYCSSSFITRSSLYKHLKKLHPGHKRFTVVSALRHIAKVKNNCGDETSTSNIISSSTCTYCDQDFSSYDILNEHLKKIHEIVNEFGKENFQQCTVFPENLCNVELEKRPYDEFKKAKFCNCGKSFKSGTELKLHLQKCSISNRSCKYCGSIHLDDYSLHFHYWSVHSEERFQDGYRLTSIKKSPLNSTKNVSIKNVTCEFCKLNYANLSLLKVHILNNHLNSKSDKMNLKNMFNYCNLCNIEFKNFRLLFGHALKSHEIVKEVKTPDKSYGKYSCNICGRRFTHSIRRDEHLLLHRNITRYFCKLCSKSIYFKTTFSNHFWLHHREKKIKKQKKRKTLENCTLTCAICCEIFNKKSQLRTHVIKHLNISYECKFCPEIFLTQRKFKSHCCNILKYPIVCCHCSKRFKTKSLLLEHREKTHRRELTCNICNKNFISLTTLKSHQRTYHGDEHLLCNECGAKFSARHRLESHMKLHSEMKHPCDACPRVFWDHRQLQHHRNMEHKEKRFICHICNRALSQKWHFEAHMDAHAGIKKYGCDDCGLKYSTWKAQSVHMKKKHPEKCKKK